MKENQMKLAIVSILAVLTGCSTPETPRTSNGSQQRSNPITFEQAVNQFNQQRTEAIKETPPADEAKWTALKVGMLEKEVEQLLGKPSGADFKNDGVTFRAVWRYTYDQGNNERTLTFESPLEEMRKDRDSDKLVDWTGRRKDSQ
jgi:outer membrane protein assembly factor BamE (lipoprotein component of BamABCDE complex)